MAKKKTATKKRATKKKKKSKPEVVTEEEFLAAQADGAPISFVGWSFDDVFKHLGFKISKEVVYEKDGHMIRVTDEGWVAYTDSNGSYAKGVQPSQIISTLKCLGGISEDLLVEKK